MEEAIREGKVRIRKHCPGGWFYLSGPERRRQVIYTIVDLKTKVLPEAYEKALADIRERFPVTRQFLLQLDDEYYYAENESAEDDCLDTGERETGDRKRGCRSFDAAVDGTRVVLSADHALMDGGLLMEIMDYFLVRYEFHDGKAKSPDTVPGPPAGDEWDDDLPDTASHQEETVDLFSLPCEGPYDPVGGFSVRAFRLAFAGEDLSSLLEITIRKEQVLSVCRRLNTTPISLFTLLLSEAVKQAQGPDRKEAVIVSIPVDYRGVLERGKHVRTAAFSVMVNLDTLEWENRSFAEKAVMLRAYIEDHKDVRKARGWIRFLKEYIGPMNRLLSMRGARAGTPEAYTFMLSYLRPPGGDVYHGKHLIFAGVSAPNDFCMLEYDGSFHLWVRPLRNERILAAFENLCTLNGLQITMERAEGASPELHLPVITGEKLPPSVFVFVSPAHGHVNPLLPLIGELVRRGYMVRVYTGNVMRESIEMTGAVCIGYDAWYEEGHVPEEDAYGFLRMLELAEIMDETVGTDVRILRPRFAIVDTESLWGRLLAEKHGLRVVLSSATQIMNMFTIAEDWLAFFRDLEPYEERISQMLEQLSEKGFPKHTLLSLFTPGTGTGCVAYIPEELQGQPETIDRSRVFYAGYSRDPLMTEAEHRPGGDVNHSEPAPVSYEEKTFQVRRRLHPTEVVYKGTRPLVYVTMGTVSSRSVWFFRSCIAAFHGMNVDVVMAVWKHIDMAALGRIPDNIRVVREVDQAQVLRKADAALFHAGLNTIVDCLLSGVPMAVFPTVADQFGNAKRVVENGAGISMDDHRPDTIRKAVSRILTDPSYREKAMRLGDRMRTMGGAKGAAEWILETVAGTGIWKEEKEE